jgi:hypothetical protein
MIDRKYSLTEIDAMRDAIGYLRLSRFMFMDQVKSSALIEEQLRTYMMAGIAPEELIEAGKKAEADFLARQVQKTAWR